jgi:SGNH domain (fused to AT3 domains)
VLCIAMLMTFIAGIAIRKLDGMKFRALSQLNGDISTLTLGRDRSALGKNCGLPDTRKKAFEFCLSHSNDAPQFVVLGDSKAEALYYGLAREALRGMPGVLIGSVLPPSLDPAANDREQVKSVLAFQTVQDTLSIKAVVLTIALRDIFPIDNDTGFIKGDVTAISADKLRIYTAAIRKLGQSGKRVIFVIDNPTLPDPRSCVSGGLTSSPFLNQFLRRKPNPRCTLTHADHVAGSAAYLQFAADLSNANPDLTIYDPTPFLCDIRLNACAITRDGKFLYSYSDHISDYANSEIAKDLLPRIEKLVHQ